MKVSTEMFNKFRTYGVRFPSNMAKQNPEYARKQVAHIDEVLSLDAWSSEESVCLQQLRAEWVALGGDTPPTPVVSHEPVKQFDLRALIKRMDIKDSRSTFFTEEEIREQIDIIGQAMNMAYEGIDGVCANERQVGALRSFRKGWEFQLRRLTQNEFGTGVIKSRPASYLARKTAKAEKDRQLRNKMTGGSSKK